jgi:hypothetical protein
MGIYDQPTISTPLSQPGGTLYDGGSANGQPPPPPSSGLLPIPVLEITSPTGGQVQRVYIQIPEPVEAPPWVWIELMPDNVTVKTVWVMT